MRRDQLILLLQPYKNGLMPKKDLGDSVNRFARLLLGLCEKHQRMRFNVALPGYILECIDALVLSSLREMVKRGSVEWLCMGYTEPFLSFSPLWLTAENISAGAKLFTELTGEPPAGCVPPFSNWEPSHIDLFNAAGLKYAVVSSDILAKSEAGSSGYWITEYTGSSMAVFPARSFDAKNAPASMMAWIGDNLAEEKDEGAARMIILKYMYALDDRGGGKNNPDKSQGDWVERVAAEIEKHILELQPLRFKDVFGNTSPLGLHYFPSSLVPSHNEPATPYFLNHLHCYDQIGVMQRKLMDICDSVCGLRESKTAAKLRRMLFFAQDINRFLPAENSGFCSTTDRLWTYGKLIGAERELSEMGGALNCVIRLTDFLRNGYKSVIISNRALKLYIDHRNGAQIYALDYRARTFNAFAAYNPRVRQRPNVIVPRESRLGFRDMIFNGTFDADAYLNGSVKDCSNFADTSFEYTFKSSPSGVRVLLNCNGGFVDDNNRTCPLSMNKVFGLEKESAALSYNYKLVNTSLTDYSFILGIEFPLSLPGAPLGRARIIGGKTKATVSDGERVIINDVADWALEDRYAGVRMEFVTQKKVNVWLLPGGTLLITCPAEIEKNATMTLTGKLTFKKISAKETNDDSL